ncbi:MAG: hypothetical protein RI924_1402 [Bacteroidota bacterium]|jgi:ABC-type Fe3+/spermidine/putrescine transport system ATPase subunit
MYSSFLQTNSVTKSFAGATRAGVFDVNLEILTGSFVAILGESGSGKSTLLKLLYGSLSPDSGEVYFKGKRILGPHEKLIPGHEQMKLIAQDFNLNTFAKVYDNIAAMLSNTDLEAKKWKTWETMEFLRIEHLAERRAADLSGGEQQRVAIARALVTEPEVLLLDEPFSQVDVMMRKQLRADLKRLSEHVGITMILVSHDPFDGLSLADQLILIRQGKILQQGPPQDIIKQPINAYVASLLGEANIISPAQAKAWLDLNLKPDECLAVYPHEIVIVDAGIPAVVQHVRYQLNTDELDVKVAEQTLTLNAPSGHYQAGDELKLQFNNYRIVAL